MTGFLASVTSAKEASIALETGADIIDLKNPAQGALGALPLAVVAEIVRFVDGRRPVSATVGDLPMQPALLCQAVEAMAGTGVDIVKVGLFGNDRHADCVNALSRFAQGGQKIVAVLFADQSPDLDILGNLAAAGFYGAMLDTANKTGGSLTCWLNEPSLRAFVAQGRRCGLLIGLAGALRSQDIPLLASLEPDYLGFRGALCDDLVRESGLDMNRIRGIAGLLRECNTDEAVALA